MTRSRDVADTQDNLGGAVAPYVAGKNKIINGDFGVWQRGTSVAVVADTFQRLADRFHLYMSGTFSATQSQQTFTPGTAPVAGYEGQYFWRNTITSITGSLTLNRFGQKIEDVRTFAGQTVTVSFWAKAGANASWTPQLVQEFGTGGSGVVFASGTSVNVTTSWQRFSQTISVPSVSGKTIGAGSCLTFVIDMPTTGAQTNDVWGVQLEAGSVATPFTTASGSIGGELALCQRYYERWTLGTSNVALPGFNNSTTNGYHNFIFKVTKRSDPTISISANADWAVRVPGGSNQTLTGFTTIGITTQQSWLSSTVSSGLTSGNGNFLVNLSNSYIEASAEL